MALTDFPFNYETQVPNYESQLSLVSLWGNFVPTMNVYSTFDSPRFYYFISHLPELEGAVARSSPDPILVKRRWWTYAHLDAVSSKRLQALGVRYVLHSLPEGDEPRSPPDEAVLRRQWGPTTVGGWKIMHTVYEYSDPNLGNYGPTNVVVARNAPSILEHFWRTSFDPRQSIILPEQIEEPLVQASSGKMLFERGAIRVQADSPDHSLLLLPMQYSHCLVLSDTVKARLLPANLVQTALLFHGSIDLRIHLDGLFRPGCRNQDLADLPELGIFNERETAPPWPQLHPYAISSAGDLPQGFGAIFKKLTNSR